MQWSITANTTSAAQRSQRLGFIFTAGKRTAWQLTSEPMIARALIGQFPLIAFQQHACFFFREPELQPLTAPQLERIFPNSAAVSAAAGLMG